jgi:hypothetical protein
MTNRGYWRSGGEISEVFGKPQSRISEWKAEGMPYLLGQNGKPVYATADVFDWCVARERPEFRNRPLDGIGWWPRLVIRLAERVRVSMRGVKDFPARYADTLAARLGVEPATVRDALAEIAQAESERLMDAFALPPMK